MLDHRQDVEAAQRDGVDVGEVDREDRVGRRDEELSPGRTGPSRRRRRASDQNMDDHLLITWTHRLEY